MQMPNTTRIYIFSYEGHLVQFIIIQFVINIIHSQKDWKGAFILIVPRRRSRHEASPDEKAPLKKTISSPPLPPTDNGSANTTGRNIQFIPFLCFDKNVRLVTFILNKSRQIRISWLMYLVTDTYHHYVQWNELPAHSTSNLWWLRRDQVRTVRKGFNSLTLLAARLDGSTPRLISDHSPA